jgi:large subunit ribosomal protein L23
MDKTMALRPRVSEKAYNQSETLNTYVFNVPMTANKLTVADAVAAQFSVTIEEVRMIVVKGKSKQSYRKGRRPVSGRRADTKKAYVRLSEGQAINIFGDVEDKKDDKDDKKAAKTDKSDKKTAQPEAKQKRGGIRQALGRAQRQTQDRGGSK